MAVRVPLLRSQTCLLRRAQRDPDAFADFYDTDARRVLTFFARRVFDAEVALDLTSETFAAALENRMQFRGRTSEEEQGWIFAIARSQLTRFFRRGDVEREAVQRLAMQVPELTTAEVERIEELAGLADAAPQIQHALNDLPADQRQAVQLRVLDEMSYEEIATVVAVSQQVIRQRVSRGLRTLAIQLADLDEIEGAA
jgi:RNA polymerase sigma-70 factor (ECF subfamily)